MNRKIRQRAPRLKISIKKLIAIEAIDNPNKPRLALALELKEKIGKMGEVPPSEETLIKMISDARTTPDSDIPWSIGLMGENKELAPEAVFYILLARDFAKCTEPHEVFSLRQAIWISRFYTVIINLVDIKAEKAKVGFLLFQWSKVYAKYEKINKSVGIESPDTSILDTLLTSGIPPSIYGNTIALVENDTVLLYSLVTMESVTDLNKNLEKDLAGQPEILELAKAYNIRGFPTCSAVFW